MSDPASKIRAFVALDLPDALRAEIGALIERLRPEARGIRWVRPESLHVTLRFLGWARPEPLAALRAALSDAAAGTPPLDAHVARLGTFPERGRARVLWLGITLPPEAHRLQETCARAAIAAGFPPEERPFAPHLTLGRWKIPARRPTLPVVDLGTVTLDRLVLFRSQLHAKGSVYTPLESHALGRR